MGGGGGRGWGRAGGHSCTRETPDNLQQVTEGSRIHRQGRREEEEEGCVEGWRGNMHGMEMRVLTDQTPRCSPPTAKENGVPGGSGGVTNFTFFFRERSSSRREVTKTNFTRLGMRRQTAAAGGSQCGGSLPLAAAPPPLASASQPGDVIRGAEREDQGGHCDVTEHISILRRTHALLREQRVRQYRGGTFWLPRPPSLTPSLTTFSFSPPSLSHPLILSHFHPSSPPHFSPSLPHSVCHPISSILLSFPLLTLPPSLPLYLRLLFFYSKLNLSL